MKFRPLVGPPRGDRRKRNGSASHRNGGSSNRKWRFTIRTGDAWWARRFAEPEELTSRRIQLRSGIGWLRERFAEYEPIIPKPPTED